jgi:DNA-binding PadR family transcriptional regulator
MSSAIYIIFDTLKGKNAMSPARSALLSLLVREPLTGYDLAQQLNARFTPFWPIRYNQIYPELARLEAEGFVKYTVVEPSSYRPAKKVYEVTPAGMEALRQWAKTPTTPAAIHDEFLLKMYNVWLLEPEQASLQINEQREVHVQRATYYQGHIEELKNQLESNAQNYQEPLSASIAALRFGLGYERHYIAWCDSMLDMISASHDEVTHGERTESL